MSTKRSNKSPKNSQVLANWTAIRSIAPDRFDAFCSPSDQDQLDAISRYIWNMDVSRELSPPLHVLEVTFRNQLHNALTQHHGVAWFDTLTSLSSYERNAISEAKNTLTRQHKPPDPGRIVAELNFGFWTSLYGRSHENDIVRPTIQLVFPHYQGTRGLSRAVVAPLLRESRLLRNRLAHHEHVVFDPSLPTTYRHMIELITWMSPQMLDMSSFLDEFRTKYGQSWPAYRPKAETIFG